MDNLKRKNINKILNEAENQIDIFNKEKIKNDQKIKELEQINEDLMRSVKTR